MKSSFLIIWNIVLTASIAFLVFQNGNETGADNSSPADSSKVSADSTSTIRIAYVDLDSLQNNYNLFVNKRKELDQKQANAEVTLQKKMKEFEAEYTAAEQAAKYMTKEQVQQKEQELLKKQSDIQELQQHLSDDLEKKLGEFNKELQDSLDSFLEHYNRTNSFTYILMKGEGSSLLFAQPQFDITADAIKGMNARLK